MEFHRPLSSDVTLPYLVPDRAAWSQRSRVAIGRRTKGRHHDEVALGSGAVEHGSRRGSSVDCFLGELSDATMAQLAALERDGTSLPDLARGMRWLVDAGLSMYQAGLVMGLPGRAEASRLNAIAEMPASVLAAMAQLRLTRNHARWLLGVPETDALSALADLTGRRADDSRHLRPGCSVSVADLRDWRRRRDSKPAYSPELLAACAAESERLSARLATKVSIEPGAEPGNRRLRLGFGSAEELAGALERLGVGYGPAPASPRGGSMRWAVVEPLTDDELAYLAGTSDS